MDESTSPTPSMQILDLDYWQQLIVAIQLWLPKLVVASILALIFYMLSIYAKKAVLASTARLGVDAHLQKLASRFVRMLILIIGLLLVLSNLGLDISALVASLGLTGFALGFALKDTISNLLSGVMVFLYQPFKIGDYIRLGGIEGEVTLIDLRYTHLTFEQEHHLIPNAKLFKDPVCIVNLPDTK